VSYPRSMGTRAALSVEEYLHTSFPDLDKEYRDGQLVERSLPNSLHGRTQALIGAFFITIGKVLSLWACSETRMKIRQGVYLIPDVAVFHLIKPALVPDTPPLVAIEILSPDDRLTEVRAKFEDYRTWGVPHVWLVDPDSKRLFTYDTDLREVPTLQIPELGVEMTPSDVFE
jgi:Uma2 family endonuclease